MYVLSLCTCHFVSVTMCCLYNWLAPCVCLWSVTALACVCWSLPGHCVLPVSCPVHPPSWCPLLCPLSILAPSGGPMRNGQCGWTKGKRVKGRGSILGTL